MAGHLRPRADTGVGLGAGAQPILILRLGRRAFGLRDRAAGDHRPPARPGDVRPDPRERCELGVAAPRCLVLQPPGDVTEPGLGEEGRQAVGDRVVESGGGAPDAIARALQETLINREVEATLRDLIRKGRGRFVDVYRRLSKLVRVHTRTSAARPVPRSTW